MYIAPHPIFVKRGNGNLRPLLLPHQRDPLSAAPTVTNRQQKHPTIAMAFICSFIPRRSHSSTARTTPLSQPRFLPHSRGHSAPHSPRLQPQCSDMGIGFPERKYDESIRIGVISTRWNAEYVDALLADVKVTLKDKEMKDDGVVYMQVPGAYEIPVAARLMCAAQKVDAVICLGVLIKGETDHYEYIAEAVSSGLMDLQLSLSTPIVFGVLCCTTAEQAEARSLGEKSHAKEWALTAIEMAQLKKSQMGGVSSGKKSVGFF